MKIVKSIADLAPFHAGHLVPTMGALHAGHAALIRAAHDRARQDRAPVVVSLFVNPAQFNDRGDFDAYPRDLDTDAHVCERLDVDCLFAPGVEDVYPPGELERSVDLPTVASQPQLEDHHRPGHFEGVYRVCRRLFELTKPRAGYFGEKDWQQLQLIRALVAQESLDLDIVGVPTVRESDGLALSSRNVLLSTGDRARALALSRALAEAGRHTDPVRAEHAGRDVLRSSAIDTDYFAVRDARTLTAPKPDRPGRALVAARVGRTRLIDNAPWPGFALS